MASKRLGGNTRSSASARWSDLSEQRKLAVLAGLCSRRSKTFKREFANVLSVGLGYKTSAGEVRPHLCLGFLVDRKTDSVRPVPTFIDTFIDMDGRRRRVSVPTDVEELGDSEPQATNVADGILVVSPGNPVVRATGAVCCLVKLEGQADLFALSCHHVLTLSPKAGGCRVISGAVVANRAGSPIGQLYEAVPMSPNTSSQLDAAIALIDPQVQVDWNHGGMRPTSVDMGLSEPVDCTVYAPGGPLDAVYIKTWPEVRLPYPGCGTVQIACAYQFTVDTRPGDSGSPVMGPAGTLYAMHFWGSPSTRFAMAIPAGYLFSPGVFAAGTLQLAT
jgi:hypothetical protein